MLPGYCGQGGGLNRAYVGFQYPISTESGCTSFVSRCGNVCACGRGQRVDKVLPFSACAHVAAVNQDVGIACERGFDDRQLISVFAGNAAGAQLCGAQIELPLLTVAQNMDGADADAPRQGGSYLSHAVTVWVEGDDLSAGAIGEKRLKIAHIATDKYDLGS